MSVQQQGGERDPMAPPRTRQEALAQALRWGRTLSHNDAMLMTESDPADRPRTLVAIVQADAAEVQRLAALWTMLPDAEGASS